MQADECKIGMTVSQGNLPLIGRIKDLAFILNDYGGLVPSALVSWSRGPDSWENVAELDDFDATVDVLAQASYERSKEAMQVEPLRWLDPTGQCDGEPIQSP